MSESAPDSAPIEEADVKLNQGGVCGQITATDLKNKKFVNDFLPNIASNLILITEDKVELILVKSNQTMSARKAWQVPLGIFATLLTVMVTATPKDALGLSKEVWHAVGILGIIVTGLWLLRDLFQLFRLKEVTVEKIIDQMKQASKLEDHTGS